jgi:hypothetical protein
MSDSALTNDRSEPVIVLGAARSGTKMLRALIAAHPAFNAIPWDVDFVWKYGNYRLPHDELKLSHLTPKIRRYIRGFFERHRNGRERVVEKTVSNALRVDFVRAVFPGCRLIHIVRDGREVAESARRMWQEPVHFDKVFEKLQAFPIAGLPGYALEYAWANLRRALHPDGRAGAWGPRFDGIYEATRKHSLIEVCGMQWQRCVEQAEEQLVHARPERVLKLRYERLVSEPTAEVRRICEFLEVEPTPAMHEYARRRINRDNLAKWRTKLEAAELDALLRIVGPTLERLGYG